MPSRKWTLPLAAAVLTGGIAAAPTAGAESAPATIRSLDDTSDATAVDVRQGKPEARPSTAAQRAAAQAARAGMAITWDQVFGTPHSVVRRGGALTGPRSGAAAGLARRWVAQNRALFDLSAAEVAALVISRDMPLTGSGGHVVTFTQAVGGLPMAYGGRINVGVTRDGRILSVTGDVTSASVAPAPARISDRQAVDVAARAEQPGTRFAARASGFLNGWTTYDRGEFYGAHYARKVAFPTASGVRTAYQVIFHKSVKEIDDVAVDAVTGAVLYRQSLVRSEYDGSGLVYPNYPGAPRGGQQVIRPFGGDDTVAPLGWVDAEGTGPTTRGNNANTYANWRFVSPAPSNTGPRPHETDGTFYYPFTDAWNETQCSGNSYRRDTNSAVTNLFYQHNRIHDEFYRLGFTEAAHNFQARNLGRGGLGGDAVQGLAQDGTEIGFLDNAFFAPLPEGLPPFSGMFLWAPIPGSFLASCVDGDFDMSVIEHEYAHGLSTRLVGGGNALSLFQSGAMGEGWSDWYALNHAFKAGLETEPVVGAYVTGNDVRGIRNWNYDENPLNYSDLGFDITGPEVHADGELWTATLWDLRKALIAAHGESAGVSVAEHLVTDGMPLTAPNPSMVDARDGILQADVNRYGGVHLRLLWKVFAHRGMGVAAGDPAGAGPDAKADFRSAMAAENGRITVKVVGQSGRPATGVKILVGSFEARVRPMAYTDADGRASLQVVAGRYDLTFQRAGLGALTVSGLSVAAGGTTTRNVTLATNVASVANGATIVTSGSREPTLPESNLIDDTEATAWASTFYPTLAVRSGKVTVKLARPSQISEIRLSAYKDPLLPRFGAMKDWTLQVSTDGRRFHDAATGTFRTTAPRPVAPLLHYRSVRLDTPVPASYVRLVVRSTQGVAQVVTAAELQVFER